MLDGGSHWVVAIWLGATEVGPLAVSPDPASIVGGDETEPGELEWVVAYQTDVDLCTGTMVSDTVMLTAAHCLTDAVSGNAIDVFWGTELSGTRAAEATRWGIHPEFCGDCDVDPFDYGFIEVGESLGALGTIAPVATQDEWDATMRRGGEVIVVGYGEDPDSDLPDDGLGIKRAVSTTISKFTAGELEFFAGGDHRDSCLGDSGGPALVRLSDGTLRLAGITSRGAVPCGDGGYYATPYPALCWLADEAGVDLRRDGCDTCDCLDTSQPEEGCCSIAADRPRWDRLLWWLPVLALRRRRV